MTWLNAAALTVLAATAMPSMAQTAPGKQHLVVEWFDEATDRKAIAGDPVYLRTLVCDSGQGTIDCALEVVLISRTFCPLLVKSYKYRSGEGSLRVVRLDEVLAIEVDEFMAKVQLGVSLMTGKFKSRIVKEVSGVMVVDPVGDEPPRVVELRAPAKNTKGLEGSAEYLEVDLHCSKVQVVAAKKASR